MSIKMKFDLISDLHNNFWPSNSRINWEGIGTSLVAVVLGDINSDVEDTYRTVVDISKYYKYVIFVDGNHEHNNQCNFQEHNRLIKSKFSKYQNIQYLNRSAIVIDNVAFMGVNGWWTFDFMEPEISRDDAYLYFVNNSIYSEPFLHEVFDTARQDAMISCEIMTKLTVDPAIREIVMLTHTAPHKKFADVLINQHPVHFTRCGSSFLPEVLRYDTNKKLKAWCFGHVHQDFDEVIDGIRYVSHPRGRQDDSPQNLFYYPKMIDTL
jgi:Icc-related predicted phosphoesterase